MHGFDQILPSYMDFHITTRMKHAGIRFIDDNGLNTLVAEEFLCKMCTVIITGAENGYPVMLHSITAMGLFRFMLILQYLLSFREQVLFLHWPQPRPFWFWMASGFLWVFRPYPGPCRLSFYRILFPGLP